jgi:hypothetical protein
MTVSCGVRIRIVLGVPEELIIGIGVKFRWIK